MIENQKSNERINLVEYVYQNSKHESFSGIIEEIKTKKRDWVNSDNFKQRILLRCDNNLEIYTQIKDWANKNIDSLNIYVLDNTQGCNSPYRNVLMQIQNLSGIDLEGANEEGVYINEPRTIPEQLHGSVIIAQNNGLVDIEGLSHEISHGAEDGILSCGLYSDCSPALVQGVSDTEYFSRIKELDVRVRATLDFLLANGFVDCEKYFTQKHFDFLSTYDSLPHEVRQLVTVYQKDFLLHWVNILPAI